jgi:hypothetical protein
MWGEEFASFQVCEDDVRWGRARELCWNGCNSGCKAVALTSNTRNGNLQRMHILSLAPAGRPAPRHCMGIGVCRGTAGLG